MVKVKVIGTNMCTGEVKSYNSMADAAYDVNGQQSHISECARHKRSRITHKGFMWEVDNGNTVGTTKN